MGATRHVASVSLTLDSKSQAPRPDRSRESCNGPSLCREVSRPLLCGPRHSYTGLPLAARSRTTGQARSSGHRSWGGSHRGVVNVVVHKMHDHASLIALPDRECRQKTVAMVLEQRRQSKILGQPRDLRSQLGCVLAKKHGAHIVRIRQRDFTRQHAYGTFAVAKLGFPPGT